jgi:hypothetical protein
MTNIYIHGILSKYFGYLFKINVNNALSAIKAIDANREGFIKKIFDLSSNDCNYCLVIDGQFINDSNQFIERRKINRIDIVPCINGSGGAIVAAIGGAAFAGSTAGIITTFLVNAALSAAISLATSYISNMINKQAAPPQQSIAVGGAASVIEAKGKSYIFNNYENVISQGAAIPVGYGKMKIGSKLINFNLKNYPTSVTFLTEIENNQNYSIFSNYLSH